MERPVDDLPQGAAPSKADAVRAALAEGITTPTEGVDFIKTRFGIELGKPMWSSYVAQQKARERKAAGEEPRTRTTPVQSTGIPASFGGDVKIIEGLIEKLGGGEVVKELSNTLASLNQKYGQAGLDSLIEAPE